MNEGKVLILRTCANNMADHGGVIWPITGNVECKYWKPVKGFENGLTGLLWGRGADAPLSLHADAIWVVAEVSAEKFLALDEMGWIKFPEATVLFTGTKNSAMKYISDNYANYEINSEEKENVPEHNVICVKSRKDINSPALNTIDATKTYTEPKAEQSVETGGYGSTLSGANNSKLIAGYGSTETAGDESTLIAGYGSTGTAGTDSSIVAGYGSTQTAGEDSSLTSGYGSTQTARGGSDLTTGYGSTGTAGAESSIIAGYGST
ncbi:Ice nucleation protein, partial [Pantoea ananatis]